MKNLLWSLLAQLLAKPVIANWLIRRAQKTPYMHILSPSGDTVYMWRWWLFNPYNRKTNKPRWSWVPFSIRVHHIARPDYDEHCHDHPWDARTIILRGGYTEKRLLTSKEVDRMARHMDVEQRLDQLLQRQVLSKVEATEHLTRFPGDTAALKHGEYHSITEVMPSGAVTLFITWRYQGTWGYLVDGVKIYWKTYLGLADDQDLPDMKKEKQS